MLERRLDDDEPYIGGGGPTENSVSINDSKNKSHKSKQSGLMAWEEEQPDYALMNGDAARKNQLHNSGDGNKCCCCSCKKGSCRDCSKKPKCCNCCMCGIICLHIIIIWTCLILIIVYAIIPSMDNIAPEIQNVYIQLFDYGMGEDHFIDYHNNKSVITKYFMNATGSFGVEAKNPNFAGFYMHDWSLDAISLNLYQNPEQWGNVHCCADHPKWNRTNKFVPGAYNFTFDQNVWFGAHDTMNMTFTLFVDHLSEELFYVGWESSWMNDWRLPLSLHGGGWGKSKIFGMDIKVLMDCDIVVNASYFFPFDPPSPLSRKTVNYMDIDEDGQVSQSDILYHDMFDTDMDNDEEFHPFKSLFSTDNDDNNVGRIPPKKYTWQKFPVLNLTCNYGVGGFKFG